MANADDDFIGVICRQTTLSDVEAKAKLAEHGGDPIAVIKEFMQKDTKAAEPRSVEANPHQMIYREIEHFMESISTVRLPVRPNGAASQTTHMQNIVQTQSPQTQTQAESSS